MLEAHDLAARRGDAQLFSGVSFSLGPGTALFVRGPNGSGKTTLLRILAGTTEAAQAGALARRAVGPSIRCSALAVFIGMPGAEGRVTVEENLASCRRCMGARGARRHLDALTRGPVAGSAAARPRAVQTQRSA